MPALKNFQEMIREEVQVHLLRRSQRFSSLYFCSLLVNTVVVPIVCVCLLTGKSQESIIPAITGLGSTAVLTMSGKESNRSLMLLIDYLEDN